MPRSKFFFCSFADCDSVFTRASDLRKHEVGHYHPERLLHPVGCDFTSLQNKSVSFHKKSHSGKKPFLFPHTVVSVDSSESGPSDSSASEDFRTPDRSILASHRKARHGYKPPRRDRLPREVPSVVGRSAVLPKPAQSKKHFQRRVTFLVPKGLDDLSSDPGYSSPEPPHSPPTLTWTGRVGHYRGHTSGTNSSDATTSSPLSRRFSTMSSRNHAPSPPESTESCSEFAGETTFVDGPNDTYLAEVERLRQDLEMEIHEEDVFNLKTGREGCLCPSWMVEAGIEGWDESVLDTHKDYYMPFGSA